MLALDAEIVTAGRRIPADNFFLGLFETALEPGELIVEVRFPVPAAASYRKFPNPASRFSIVGVFVARLADGAVRVAVTGAGPCVFRVKAFERALAASFTPGALSDLSVRRRLTSGHHGSAAYRDLTHQGCRGRGGGLRLSLAAVGMLPPTATL